MLNKLYKNHIKEIDNRFKKLKKTISQKCKYCNNEDTIIVKEYIDNKEFNYSICKKHFLIESFKYYTKKWNSYYKNQKK